MAGVARQVLTFEAGGALYAVDAATVSEVSAAPPITRVPQAPPALKGVANLRGEVLPIVSAPTLLGHAPSPGQGRVIVMKGAAPLGLAVDRIGAMQGVEPGEGGAVIGTAEGAARLLDVHALVAEAMAGAGVRPARPSLAGLDRGSAADAVAEAQLAFLAVRLAGQAYAIALEEVAGVAPAPPEITRLPHADAVALGVAAMPGGLLPIVSLHALLGLESDGGAAAARVVEVRLGGQRIGLLVDAAAAVLRARPSDLVPAPAILNRGAGEARIDAILKTPQGPVAVLAVERIFREATVAALLAEGADAAQAETGDAEGDTAIERFLLFRLGEETYGLPVGVVEEVTPLPATLTRAPKAPAFVAGVMAHRGAVVPLVDQSRRFGVAEDPSARRKVIITREGDVRTGFIVDAVEEVVAAPEEALRPSPNLAAGEAAVFDRVAVLDLGARIVLLVDPRALLDQAERDLVRAIAAGSGPAAS